VRYFKYADISTAPYTAVFVVLSRNTFEDMAAVRQEQDFPMSLHFRCTFASGTCR